MDTKHIAALSRKAMGSQISILRSCGFSYAQIEEELRLNPDGGTTAWRLENGGKKPLPSSFASGHKKPPERKGETS